MARIEVTTHVEAGPRHVWSVLVDWEGQPRWMEDARSVEVLSDHRTGQGVVLNARTELPGGIVVDDPMEVTDWDEPHALAVHHRGQVIRGVGAFELTATRAGTKLVWWEEVQMPFGIVGEALGDVIVVPYVTRVFRRSLAGLKRVCESTSVRP